MENRLTLVMREMVEVIARVVLITVLAFILLFQGLVLFTGYYSRELAVFVASSFKNFWPAQLQVQRIQFAWYHLRPTIFLNGVSVDSTEAGWRLRPGGNVGIELTNLAAFCRLDWMRGAWVLQNIHVVFQQDYLAKVGASTDAQRHAAQLDGGRLLESPLTDHRDGDSVARLVRAVLCHGTLFVKNSSVLIYHGNRLLLGSTVKRGQLTNDDNKHRLQWLSSFNGRLLRGKFSGDLQLYGRIHLPGAIRVGGELKLSDYQIDTDACEKWISTWRIENVERQSDNLIRRGDQERDGILRSGRVGNGRETGYHLSLVNLNCYLRRGVIRNNSLPQNLRLRYAQWNLGWDRRNRVWKFSDIGLRNNDCELKGTASLLLADRWQDTELKILATLMCHDASKVRNYYPKRVIPDEGLAWLNQAFVGGTVPIGHFTFKGKLGNFPFDDSPEELFKIELAVKKIKLLYDKEWPTLDDIDGKVVFLGSKVQIDAEHSNIMGIGLDRVNATIADISNPELKVDGSVTTELPKLVQFVNRTPLKDQVGKRLTELALQGHSDFALRLFLPLWQTPMDAQLQGNIAINEGTIALPELPTKIHHVTGIVKFNQDGILPSQMVGKILDDRAVRFNLRTMEHSREVVVDADTTLWWSDLTAMWPKIDWDWGDGQLPLKLSVIVPETRGHYQLTATSDLKGLRIKLPAPLAKDIRETAKFTIVDHKQGDIIDLNCNYRNWLRGEVRLKQQEQQWQLLNGTVLVGGGDKLATNLDSDDRLTIKMRLDKLYLQPWLAWWNGNVRTKNGDISALLPPSQLNLSAKTNQLLLAKHNLGLSELLWSRGGNRQTELHVITKPLQGSLFWPEDPKKTIDVKLAFLDLDFLSALNVELNSEAATRWLPIQPCRVAIEKLVTHGQQLKKFKTKLTSTGLNQAVFKDLELRWDSVHLLGEGDLRLSKSGRPVIFNLKGSAQCYNLGQQLSSANITDHLAGGDSQISGELRYQAPEEGDVQFFDWRYLTGELHGKVTKGALVNLERATTLNITLGKVINALSIESLPKRLFLDFHDVAKSGLFFSSVVAACKISGSDLNVEQILLKSPAADVTMHGILQLVKRQYDLQVKVMPHVTKSVPIVAALVGGPLVGAVSLLADTVATAATGKIINYDYHLVGGW